MPWSGDVFSGQDVLSGTGAPLIGPDDFAEWYGIVSPTNDQLNRIQTACEIASAQIRNGRRFFTPVTNDLVTIDSEGGLTLLMPKNRLPVTAVALVEQLSGESYVTLDSTEYDWSVDGILSRWWTGWPCRAQGVRVTYSHGYDVIPREVAGVCLSLAGRLYNAPSGQVATSMTLGDYSATYEPGGSGLLPHEVDVLTQYEAIA